MPCLANKITVGSVTVGLGLTAVLVVQGLPTVSISAAALAAMAIQFAGLFGAMVALADCLDKNDRHADGDSLRREVDAIKLELERIPH